MPSISKDINQPNKKTRTLGRIDLLTFFMLICLIGSIFNSLLLIKVKLVKKIRTAREVFGTMASKNRVASAISVNSIKKEG